MKVLDATGLVKRYKRTTAVAGVSLTVDAGERVALLGANGAGKTTTLLMLLGAILPDEGSVTEMAADLPENYARYPGPFQFIRDVPTDWAQTRVLNGEVGDYVTMARKDRDSDDWYVGAVTDEQARELRIPLAFLDAGKTYTAEIYRDGDGAGFDANPHAIAIERRSAHSTDTWPIRIAAGGGFAIRFVAPAE